MGEGYQLQANQVPLGPSRGLCLVRVHGAEAWFLCYTAGHSKGLFDGEEQLTELPFYVQTDEPFVKDSSEE